MLNGENVNRKCPINNADMMNIARNKIRFAFIINIFFRVCFLSIHYISSSAPHAIANLFQDA